MGLTGAIVEGLQQGEHRPQGENVRILVEHHRDSSCRRRSIVFPATTFVGWKPGVRDAKGSRREPPEKQLKQCLYVLVSSAIAPF